MNLTDIRKYLESRINAEELLALPEEEFGKYASTASNIISMTYSNLEVVTEIQMSMMIAEEMIFLFNGDIDLNLFYEYNGLTSFDIGGAVKGTVDYSKYGDLISPMLKAYADSLGLIQNVDFNSNHKTAFARV